MITDAENTLAAATALTATAVSPNTIDLSQARDVGPGEDVRIYFSVDVALTSGGATTLQIQAITSAAANLGSPTVLVQSDAIPKASLVAGFRYELVLPGSVINKLGQRYLGLQLTVNVANFSGGSYSAGISIDGADNTAIVKKTYPSGFSVL